MKTNLISFVDHGEKIKTKLKTLLPTQHGRDINGSSQVPLNS